MLDVSIHEFVLASPRPDATPFAHRLLGSATLDLGPGLIVIHNVKLVRLDDGRLILCFPNRIEHVRCQFCDRKTSVLGHYCQHCGYLMPPPDPDADYYHDIAHPVTHEGRRLIEELVLDAWRRAVADREAIEATNGRAG